MKVTTIMLLSLTVMSGLSETNLPIVGKWILPYHRTVIGTGTADSELTIQGSPGNYYAHYSFGTIELTTNSIGPIRHKSVITTYWGLHVDQATNIFSFVVPERNEKLRLQLSTGDGGDCLVILPNDPAPERPALPEGVQRVDPPVFPKRHAGVFERKRKE